MPMHNPDRTDHATQPWSALLDGELPLAQTQDLLAQWRTDTVASETLAHYQWLGDVMRQPAEHSAQLDSVGDSDAFWRKLQAQLPAMPTMPSDAALELPALQSAMEPLRQPEGEPVGIQQAVSGRVGVWPRSRAAANQARWRWLGATAASVLVVALAWYGGWLGSPAQRAGGAEMAQATEGDSQAVMLRDPQLDALLEAHQEAGGHSALQMPAGFIRNATLERSAP